MPIQCSSCGMLLQTFAECGPHSYEHMEIEFLIINAGLAEHVESDFPIMFIPIGEDEDV